MLFIYVHAFISRHVKMIQNDLLYNKIECYNIAAQRKLNIKKEPLLLSSFYLCPGIYLQACENDTKRSLIQ